MRALSKIGYFTLIGLLTLAGGADPNAPDWSRELGDPGALSSSRVPASVQVRIVPRSGVSGTQRINLAVPSPKGLVSNPANVRVLQNGVEVRSARRGLSKFSDGTFRSVPVQLDLAVSGQSTLDVRLGEPAVTASLSMVP